MAASQNSLNHIDFMKAALAQAHIAFELGEIPIGAVIVHSNKIIAKSYNQVQTLKDPTAHAEMLAITSACNHIGAKYLIDCALYVTLEPCPMCAGAIRWAQLSTLVYAASDTKMGYNSFSPLLIPPKVEIIKGILDTDASHLLKMFFQNLRL
jgi:tRNA(adenine34) deaminase